MKTKLKKFVLSSFVFISFSVSAFSASSFEAIINIPIGIGLGIPSSIDKLYGFKSAAGFDIGIAAQLGGMIGINNNLAMSLLIEIGYSHDSVGLSLESSGYFATSWMDFNSFQIGLLPKFNIAAGNGNLSLSIGGGVKIPLAIAIHYERREYGIYYAGNLEKMSLDLNMKYFRDNFEPVMGYIKASLDYSIFLAHKHAVNIGLYLGFDILPNSKTAFNEIRIDENMFKISNNRELSFDIGIQIGYRFAKKL